MSDVKLDGDRVVVEGNLDVDRRMRIREAGDTAGIWFHQSKPAQDQAFVGMASDTAVGFWGNTGADWGMVMDTTTGNVGIGTGGKPPAARLEVAGEARCSGSVLVEGRVGIGTNDPQFSLDVADRMRVRQGNNTAGIWFHQSKPGRDQAFVGMATDTAVGFWGNTGANWGMVMDTTTGNVGIGTGQKAPQARLEVQGETRCSGPLSIHGAVETVLSDFPFNPGSKSKKGGAKVLLPTSIVVENDSIRVSVGTEKIDLVAEVRRLRDEVAALKAKLGS